MQPVRIRAARADDAAILTRITLEVFLSDQARYIEYPLDPEFVRSFTQDLVGKAWERMWIAEHADRSLGVNGATGVMYVEGAKVEALNVVPAARRRGVGSALMARAEAGMIVAGLAEAAIDTQEANAPARAFYSALGYGVVRRWLMTGFTPRPIPMVTMTRELRRQE